jgi:hypothetical protein
LLWLLLVCWLVMLVLLFQLSSLSPLWLWLLLSTLLQHRGHVTPDGPSLYPLKNYRMGAVLGKGSFGEVCKEMVE